MWCKGDLGRSLVHSFTFGTGGGAGYLNLPSPGSTSVFCLLPDQIIGSPVAPAAASCRRDLGLQGRAEVISAFSTTVLARRHPKTKSWAKEASRQQGRCNGAMTRWHDVS